MIVSKRNIVIAEVGELLVELKQRMLDLKSEYEEEVYGIFNGELYICYPIYKDIDQITTY